MCSDQPLVCCICGRSFAANAGGRSGHKFREGVCSAECQTRKAFRAAHSVMGVVWDGAAEDAHVEHLTSAHTDEERERDAILEGLHAQVRTL